MVPNLRFPIYDEIWQKKSLYECSTSLDYGLSASAINYDNVHKYIRITDIDEDTNLFDQSHLTSPQLYDDEHIVKENDILFARTGASVGKTYHYNKNDGLLYYAGFLIAAHIKEKYCSSFIFYYTQTFRYKKWIKIMSARSGQPSINADEYGSLTLWIPSDNEQKKIACLLEKIDIRIQTQIKIIELKQSLIKDIEDRILWKSTNTHFRPISDFIVELNDKSKIQNQYPLLSSTKRGLFLQTDYFNKEASSSNNIGYKIVHKGDIIISPQNLWMGNITYNDKFDNGLVSPSYRIYKVKEEYNAFYISRILMSYRALSLYKNISEQGASIVRRNLNVDAFNELCFPIPDIKKQDEVGLFLSKLHQELNSEIEILRQLKNQKKYLLCNLFI